jgi:hypothetical protein
LPSSRSRRPSLPFSSLRFTSLHPFARTAIAILDLRHPAKDVVLLPLVHIMGANHEHSAGLLFLSSANLPRLGQWHLSPVVAAWAYCTGQRLCFQPCHKLPCVKCWEHSKQTGSVTGQIKNDGPSSFGCSECRMSTSLPNDYRILVGPCPRSIHPMADLQGLNSQGTGPIPTSFNTRFASSIVTSISLVFSAVLLGPGEYWFLHFTCMSKCKIN